jgi:hypothetical protein
LLILPKNQPPLLARPNAAPPHHHHLIPTTPSHPPTFLHGHFQQRTQNRAPAARFRTFGPKPTICACASRRGTTAPPYHLPPSLLAAIPSGAPVTEPQRLGFRLLPQNLSPPLARPNAAPPHYHHLVPTTPPPPPTFLHCRFQWCTRNRVPAAPFWFFSPPIIC